MKKLSKKVLLYGLPAVCLSAMLLVTVFAEKDSFTEPSDVFIDVCNHLFTEGSGYKAIDKNGNDVTAQFVRDYRDAYLSDNFMAIWDAVADELSYITGDMGE